MKKILSLILVSMFPQLIFSKTNGNINTNSSKTAITSCSAMAVTKCIKVSPWGETYTVTYTARAYSWSQGASLSDVCAAAQNAAIQANLNACGN